MNALVPIYQTLPDGRTAVLRATVGARKRLRDKLGADVQLSKQQVEAVITAFVELSRDENGNPTPEGLTVEWFDENMASKGVEELFASVVAALHQDPNKKKELMEKMEGKKEETSITSGSSPTAPSTSESPAKSSGGATSNAS
jgi:hypothetical protein